MYKDLTNKELSNEGFTISGGVNKNGNESVDGRIASADCRQLIDSKTVLVIRTSGDRLIMCDTVVIIVRVIVESSRTAVGAM